jgi:hypothetical protein
MMMWLAILNFYFVILSGMLAPREGNCNKHHGDGCESDMPN